ncbi:MAG: CoA ligase [Bacteroides sp. SM23_62_1]|nr:MAG: CoA ligase [Bacteroides sp. SM23_62_1]
MLVKEIVNPKSIIVVGGSNSLQKPGGKVLWNIRNGTFRGGLYVLNPKETEVQGLRSYQHIEDLPETDLAVLAIPARQCLETVKKLAEQKGVKGFIILSAGFAEEGEEGAKLEKEIAGIIEKTRGSLIGPNCIGVINPCYQAVFTTPVPKLDPLGCDFISGSGATAVFIMEAGIPRGLTFSSVYSVGNSAQTGIEEVLEYMDHNFNPETSSRIKLLYIEHIEKPGKLLEHASSLIRKGSRIAAIKAGTTEAGSRAASSHTGALASPDSAVDALFRKAGIVRCFSKAELATVASVFAYHYPRAVNFAIITHAGGPSIMLTDVLSEGGINVPPIENPKRYELLEKLYPGSSVANPIDFLATGNAEQLGYIIDYCDKYFHEIEGMIVIFGSPGLISVSDVYSVIDEKMRTCRKPIFPVLPSFINAKDEIQEFINRGRINFPEEVELGRALIKIYRTPPPAPEIIEVPDVEREKIRCIIDQAGDGFLEPDKVASMLDAIGITRVDEAIAGSPNEAKAFADRIGYPVVMKIIGVLHKSDVGGVVLNIQDDNHLSGEYQRLTSIQGVTGILIQPMLRGMELFAGLKYQKNFGSLIVCGLGGIFVEVMRDVQYGLAPLSGDEALTMIRNLKGYQILEGTRGQEPVSETLFAEILVKLSALAETAPEIKEMDINPLMGVGNRIIAVDTRIWIEKKAKEEE